MAIKDINGPAEPTTSLFDQFTAASAGAEEEPGDVNDNSDTSEDDELDDDVGDDADGEQEQEGEDESQEGEHDEEAAEAPSVKFKADGQEFNFTLKPDDQNLVNTLKWGVLGKRLHSERDKAREDVKTRDKRIKALEAEVADKQAISELKEAGFIDRAIMRAVGVDEFKAWFDKAYQERLEREANGEDATASRLRELEESKRFVEYESSKERKRIEEERAAREQADETKRVTSISEQMLAKYSFDKLGIAPELAEHGNRMLWEAAMGAVLEASASLAPGETLSPQMIEQAFKSSREKFAKLIGKTAEVKANKQVAKMKSDAKTKAGTIAKQNYGSGAKKEDFTGMSMTDVLKRMAGQK